MLTSPQTSNQLLASLAPGDLHDLLPHLKVIELPRGKILFAAGDTIDAIYFPDDGLVSFVSDLSTGEIIEVGMVGRDSVVGITSAFGNKTALSRAVVQIPGRGSVLHVGRFCDLAERSATFRAVVTRHQNLMLAQARQSAACNATHPLEARLARWLLRCKDLLHSEDIPLTQEYMAELLGVRRTTVTLVAKTLQKAGLIEYRRGHIRIQDLDGLRESACECYATLKAHSDRLLGTPTALTTPASDLRSSGREASLGTDSERGES
jgi:CRP-like cAMP-binding protein